MLTTRAAISGAQAAMSSTAKPPVECPTSVTGRSPASWRMAVVKTRAIISAVN
jgi:hypothetical protein